MKDVSGRRKQKHNSMSQEDETSPKWLFSVVDLIKVSEKN